MTFFRVSWYEILITTVYLINFLAIINLIFREKRSIETTIAWVLILIIIPAVGCILYISFGRGVSKDNMFKIKEAEDKIIKDNIISTYRTLQSNKNFLSNFIEHSDMIYALANSNHANFTTNNNIDIYADSDRIFNSL